jgi:ferrous iron transport protein B
MEMRLPLVIAFNMMDVARERGVQIDTAVLARRLSCPVIPLVASKRQGVDTLQAAIARIATERTKPMTLVHYQPVIEDAISALTPTFQRMFASAAVDSRWAAITALSDDAFATMLA